MFLLLTVFTDQTDTISCDKKPNRVKDMKLLAFACILLMPRNLHLWVIPKLTGNYSRLIGIMK